MADWIKEKSTNSGGKEGGKPHPDAKFNFKQWKNVYKGIGFRKNLASLKCNVCEFFLFNNSQVSYHIFKPGYTGADGERYPPLDDQGVLAPTPSDPNNRKMPDWYTMAEPLCVQVSFAIDKIKNSANINFQQENAKFRDEMKYYLKIDWEAYDRQMYND